LPYFYHVDRDPEQFLQPGAVMALRRFDFKDKPEETAHLNERYPNGIGRWGLSIIRGLIPPGWLLDREITLENVRSATYPFCPSRFATVFACHSIEDAEQLRGRRFGDGADWRDARIWIVEAAAWFRADMSIFHYWVNTNLEGGAHAYWSQEISPNPFFEYLLTPPVTLLEVVGRVGTCTTAEPDSKP
jgi:hypothetical protein